MKKRVLIFIDWFYPAYKAGGPVKSVYNLVQTLHKNYQFYIICSNLDIDGEKLDVTTNEWTSFQEIPVIYLTKEQQNIAVYRKLYKEIDPACIYYNSLFSKQFTLVPYKGFKKESVTQLIAPRGMLGEGALSIKPLKKIVFLKLAKKLLFEKEKTFWHATSIQEAAEIKNVFGKKVNISIAQNLSSPIVKRRTIKKIKGELKLVFVSRLAVKKNLLFALKLMDKLKGEHGISLDIYGPIEEKKYWQKCNSIIKNDKRIQYKGILAPQEIAPTLQNFHFYILPTLHENYGHSIVEALVSGVPVIISENTPWRDIEQKGIGADLNLENINNWITYIKKGIELSQSEYDLMVMSCFQFSKEHIVDPSHKESAEALFKI